jgi:hypothetical protein
VKDLTNELKAYATNNINNTNNTIKFDLGLDNNNIYTIPRGKYNGEYLADYLSSRNHAKKADGADQSWTTKFAYKEATNNFFVKNTSLSADLKIYETADSSGILGLTGGFKDIAKNTVITDLGEEVNFTIKTKGIDPNTSAAYTGRSSDMVIATTKIAKNSAFITMVHAYQTIGEPLF